MITLSGILVSAALLAGPSKGPPAKRHLMPLNEILKAMQASPVEYKLNDLDKALDVEPSTLIDVMYPLRVEPVDLPQTRWVKGKRIIDRAPCDPAMAKIHAAEPIFQAKKYAEAAPLYEEAVKLAPKCYLAYAYRGDAAFYQGMEGMALADYDKALALNPDDGSIYVFRANALQHLKRYPEMLDALRWSLALRPRNPLVLKMLHDAERPLHLTVRSVDIPFHGFARQEGDAIAIYADAKRPAWLMYASCKGFWIGEPSHRKAVLGTTEHPVSSDEELECLAALLDAAYKFKDSPDTIQEPGMRQLTEIVQAGYAGEWIVYELVSRESPQIVLTFSDAERQRMFEFVKRFIAVDDAAN